MALSRSSLMAMNGGGDEKDKGKKSTPPKNELSKLSTQAPVIRTALNRAELDNMSNRMIKSGMRGPLAEEVRLNAGNQFYTTKGSDIKTPLGVKTVNETVDFRGKINNWLPEQTAMMLEKVKAKNLSTPASIEANKEYLMGYDDKGNAMRHHDFGTNFPDFWDKFKLLAKGESEKPKVNLIVKK